MKKRNNKKWALCALLCAALLCPAPGDAQAEGEKEMNMPAPMASYKKEGENNPLYTQRFGADPGVMEYDGRLYVYMTDDLIQRDAAGNAVENTYGSIRCLNCLSSDDLVNWTDHGRIPVAGYGGAAPWARNSWAPCAAHKEIDGREKFFLYFCDGGNGIGVLTSDSPTGPWTDELGGLLISRRTPNCANVVWLFDPAVMVDEDGTGYLAFGGGVPEGKQAAPGTGRIVRLGADMLSLDCDPVTLEAPFLFEDSGINRIGDTYVYSYCSNWQTRGNAYFMTSGAIQYMTAQSPLGPYTYQGELFPNEGRFFGLYGNNHHSIGCLNGEYYLFYHSRPVEQAMGITGNYRSPQIDRLTVLEEGKLQQVKGTMRGVEQLKPLDASRPVSAATQANQAGIAVKVKDGAPYVEGDAGSWIKVSKAQWGRDAGQIQVTVDSQDGGVLYVLLGGLEGPAAAQITIPAGTDAGTAFTAPFAAEGPQDVYFLFGGPILFSSWQIIP